MLCPSCGGPLIYQADAFKAVCDRCAAIAQEPPEPDGEAFRGGEAAAYEREQRADIQRTLK